MEAQSPQIVGIVGGSCAGKSWLADRLVALRALAGERAARFSQDDFYRDRSHLPAGRRAKLNFDHPQAIDWERLEEVIAAFSEGQIASVPRYDYATHRRVEGECRLQPAPLLVVEGLWLFRRPSLRKLFDLKIYIQAAPALCRERRLRRDTAERGRTRDQVLEQLERFTIPMFERFVAPQKKWADIVVNAPVQDENIMDLMNRIGNAPRSLSVGI